MCKRGNISQQDGGPGDPNLISPTETTKTVNKQLQTNENNSGKALDYNKKSSKTPAELKTQGWSHRKAQEAFCPHLPLLRSRAAWCTGIHSEEAPHGVNESRRTPASHTTVDVCSLYYHGLPQSTPLLIPAHGAVQPPHHQAPPHSWGCRCSKMWGPATAVSSSLGSRLRPTTYKMGATTALSPALNFVPLQGLL